MLVRQLIIAVLMLLSLSAQASDAWFNCGRSGAATPDCCDRTHGCPSQGNVRLSCDQACSTDIRTGVSATFESELWTPTLDPIDGSAALVAHFYELLAAVASSEPAQQPVDPPAARYPTNPTYLATARLRL